MYVVEIEINRSHIMDEHFVACNRCNLVKR